VLDTGREALSVGAWAALEGAFEAWRAGGLPCGAALVAEDGSVLARGRNHAYDPPTGTDRLEGNPLAHAELNVLARLAPDHDPARETLWSTQQPCSMCTAAIAFCGVGATRYLAADPAFVATDDARAGVVADPTVRWPELTAWAVLANALFLQPAVAGGHRQRLDRNERIEPEMVAAARAIGSAEAPESLDRLVDDLWPRLTDWASARRRRQ
jgi:tRNA(Arg) A34 adenosine deaminase TadA